MTNTIQKVGQNQSMDLCKMIASLLVLFVHIPFPGALGSLVDVSARFSVPMFLAITGYFNYGASAATIARRMLHIVKLTVFACIFYMISNALNAHFMGVPVWDLLAWDQVTPSLPVLMRWFMLHWNPFSEHLWYLSAVTLCYFLLWLYVSAFGEKPVNYRPVYLIGLFVGGLLIYSAVLLPWAGNGVDCHVYRNGWIMGISLFTLGLFLHEYQDTLFRNLHLKNRYLVVQMLFGFVLSLCEWGCGIVGEVTLGHLILLPALMTLLIRHPRLPVKSPVLIALISRFRSLSTAIYILHCAFIWVYDRFFQPLFYSFMGDAEALFRPFGVLILTLIGAVIWDQVDIYRSKKRK